MKQKLLSALIATACASLAMSANAGVIQASYKNYAAEVFGTDAVVLTAPTIGYALALPLTGTVANPNQFSIQWTLTSGGEWNAAPAAANIQLVQPDNSAPLNASSVTLSADKKTLTANFTVTSNYTVGSQIVLGAGGPVQVTKVGTILGAPAAASDGCTDAVASVNVKVKLTNAAGVEFDSDFGLAPLKNETPIVQSRRALEVVALSSGAYPRTTLGALATDIESSKVDVLNPSLGKNFTNAPVDLTNSLVAINLGQIVVRDRAVLFDLDGTTAYSTGTGAFPVAAANTSVGIVEANSLTFKVTGRFATGATITVAANTVAAGGNTVVGAAIPATVTFNTARTEATVTIVAANMGAITADGAGSTPNARRVNIIYTADGINQIPTAQFSVISGSLTKYSTALEANNAVCPGSIYNLTANGVQVDVRNYIPDVARVPSTGWYSVVRVINTDESALSVDVLGTALLRNGTLGATAVIAPAMKAREVRYLTSAQIDALLNAAATPTALTFGADDIGSNARLRITAPSSSIRVQNYHFNPTNGNFFEASSSQGDDGIVNAAAPTVADVVRARADGQNK